MRRNCTVLVLFLLMISIYSSFAQDTAVSTPVSFGSGTAGVTAGPTAGVIADATADATANATAIDAADAAVDATTNATNATADVAASPETTESTEPLSVQGIWTVSLGGNEITMAVNQSGDSLFGQAKFEGAEPWNGAIAGSLSGRAVHIALAALQGKVLVSTQMSGTVQDDSIAGSYVRSNSDGVAAKGEFTAARISTDATQYTPAEITATSVAPETEPAPAAQTKSTRYNDVRDLAKGIDPNILPRYAVI